MIYRQPNHTLYIVFSGGSRGDPGMITPPPLLELVPRSPPPPWNVDDVTRAMSKGRGGGGVLVNVQEWGCFSNWWPHAGNVQGGCLWMSSHTPPPLQGNPVAAPGVPPILVIVKKNSYTNLMYLYFLSSNILVLSLYNLTCTIPHFLLWLYMPPNAKWVL